MDLREFKLRVIWVHRLDLLSRRRSQDFDDLHKLVDATLAREQRGAACETLNSKRASLANNFGPSLSGRGNRVLDALHALDMQNQSWRRAIDLECG